MDKSVGSRILRGMTQRSQILITGGGLNGATLALALAQCGHMVTLIDALPRARREKTGFDGRSYALALASTKFLAQIGLWAELAAHAQPMREIKVSDGLAGQGPSPFFLHFEESDLDEGPMGYMVEDRFLRRALLDALAAEPKITEVTGQTVLSQTSTATGITVTLDSGKTLTGDLLVGADG
ncbi:MAG: FAD-dependent monooxygenase, partial [Epibacterium sp.]|nr:FAD-dependent monooxygenase [Epibacterium sp.]NQX73228.1 FAD-dependent monooxygenase [Epibacterium sp.]